MVNLKFSQLIWMLLTVLVVSFTSFFGLKILLELSITDRNWVGAFLGMLGNILGGVIGGIVALLIAKYQISQALSREKEIQKQSTTTMLSLIREELRDNITFIESADISNDIDFRLLKTQLSDDTWKSTMFNLNISNDLIVKLNICYRKISLIKSVQKDEIDQPFLDEAKQQIETSISTLSESIPSD